MTGVQAAVPPRYELVARSQAGAEQFLRDLGALAEIEEALLGHCEAHWPEPPYKPQEYKKRLAKFGWQPEVRVPPYSPAHDDLPINERYDALKFFDVDREEVGLALKTSSRSATTCGSLRSGRP